MAAPNFTFGAAAPGGAPAAPSFGAFGAGATNGTPSTTAPPPAPAFGGAGAGVGGAAAAPFSFSFGATAPSPAPAATGGDTGSDNAFKFGGAGSAAAAAPAAPLAFGAPPETTTGGDAFGTKPAFGATFGGGITASPPTTGDATKTTSAPAPVPAFPGFGSLAAAPSTLGGGDPGQRPTAGTSAFGGFGAAASAGSSTTAAPSTGGEGKRRAEDNDDDSGKTPAPAPAAAGGGLFSFGAAGAPAAGSGNDNEAANSSAPAAPASTDGEADQKPSFAFGGASGGTTTPAPAPAAPGGGFSFGASSIAGASGTTTPPKTTPTTPATPGIPLPVDTPGTNFKTVGATTPATGTPAATTSAASLSSAQKAPEPQPLEYQTLTVEQILNKFQQQLEADALAYMDEAKRVCEYDAILRDGQRDLAALTNQAQRLLLEQEQAEQELEGIGAFQNELEKTLLTVEHQIGQLYQTQSHLAPQDADVQREETYELAKAINERLDGVGESLQTTFSQLSAANERAFTGETGKVMTILNQHQDTLSELEVAAAKLEVDTNQVVQMLNTSRA